MTNLQDQIFDVNNTQEEFRKGLAALQQTVERNSSKSLYFGQDQLLI